jgi:hypothetical protein
MNETKIKNIVNEFFDSLKSHENQKLETGLSQHETVDILKASTLIAIEKNPQKFEVYVNWILDASMYLLDESEDHEDIETQLRNMQ